MGNAQPAGASLTKANAEFGNEESIITVRCIFTEAIVPPQVTAVPSTVTGIVGHVIDEKWRFLARVWRVNSAAMPDGLN